MIDPLLIHEAQLVTLIDSLNKRGWSADVLAPHLSDLKQTHAAILLKHAPTKVHLLIEPHGHKSPNDPVEVDDGHDEKGPQSDPEDPTDLAREKLLEMFPDWAGLKTLEIVQNADDYIRQLLARNKQLEQERNSLAADLASSNTPPELASTLAALNEARFRVAKLERLIAHASKLAADTATLAVLSEA